MKNIIGKKQKVVIYLFLVDFEKTDEWYKNKRKINKIRLDNGLTNYYDSELYWGLQNRSLDVKDFDLSFVLQRAWPFRLLSCLAGVPVRGGFGCGRKDFFLTHSVFTHQIQNESGKNQQYYQQYLYCLHYCYSKKSYFY